MVSREKLAPIKPGRLVVITGMSCSGKDSILEELLKTPEVISAGYSKVVTHATRPPRPGETHGSSYYFITQEELFEMHQSGELVESPTQTGDSFKGTSKKELLKVVEEGLNLIWRIDLSRAAEVASGDFFTRMFEADVAEVLRQNTSVFLIDTSTRILIKRRKNRDLDKYDPRQYELRDSQDRAILRKSRAKFRNKIRNYEGRLESAVGEILKHLFE
jgi:guanylate kinase